MDQQSSVTSRPPVPRVVRLCIISADREYCGELEGYLDLYCAGSVKLVGMFPKIPDQEQTVFDVDVLAFEPTHPDFLDQVDGIPRVQNLFGDRVRLVALINGGTSEEDVENLEASGVSLVAYARDFSHLAQQLDELDLSEKSGLKESGTSITPLRPLPIQVTLTIVDSAPTFSKSLFDWFHRHMPGIVFIEDTFEEIPEPSRVHHLSRAIIFDPEMDDFRQLQPALKRMREAFGDALLIAHTDAWHGNNRLRKQLLEAGIRLGLGRNEFPRFQKLIEHLSLQEPIDYMVEEFGT